MPSIRVNSKLKLDIVDNIKAMFAERLKEKLPEQFWFDLMHDIFENQFRKYIPAIPESWLSEIKYIRVYLKIEDRDYRIDQFKTVPVPFKMPAISPYVDNEVFTIQSELWPDAFVRKYVNFTVRIDNLEQEQADFIDKAETIFESCNTVKQLLKFWPEANALLPTYIIDQLNGKVAERPRESRDVPLDQDALDSLNVSLMRNTIINRK